MSIKKQIGLILTLTFLVNNGFGQSQKSFDDLISETKGYLIVYDTLYAGPNSNYLLSDFNLSKKQIEEIIKADYDGSSPTYNDTISGFSMVQYYNEKILENLKSIISHPHFRENDIINLLSHCSSSLSITVSPDKKLYNFSLDEKNVGVYVFNSIMYYTGILSDSLPTFENIDKGGESNPYIIFGNVVYHNIYSVKTNEGHKYVLIGNNGCSMLVKSVYFENGIFKQDFAYPNPLKSCWDGEISYDQDSKTIIIDYITDNSKTTCECTNYANFNSNSAIDYSNHNVTEQENKRCQCTVEYIEDSWEIIKK